MATGMTDKSGGQIKSLAWGVLGASRIGRKVIPAIREAGDRIVAIGASSRERAEPYARELEIERVLDGYQAVIDDPAVEAVYLPLANDQHFRWALACARAGKACLSEKPLVLTADEARQLREAFAAAGARLAEGFMWRHHPQIQWLLAQLREGEIGDLLRVHAEFSFMLDRLEDYRWRDEMGGGSLWDIGVYCVNAARLFFGDEPRAVSARLTPAAGARRADATAAGWLDFGRSQMATFQSSFISTFRQSLVLTGTRGTIELERPFVGALDHPVAARRTTASGVVEETFGPCNAYAAMVAHFRRAVRDASFALTPAEDGLAQARVMEALFESGLAEGAPRAVAEP